MLQGLMEHAANNIKNMGSIFYYPTDAVAFRQFLSLGCYEPLL